MSAVVTKSDSETISNDVIKITLENYIPWLENKFNDKYGPCLERF